MIRGHVTRNKIYAVDVTDICEDEYELVTDLLERVNEGDIVVYADSLSDLEDMFQDREVEFIEPEED